MLASSENRVAIALQRNAGSPLGLGERILPCLGAQLPRQRKETPQGHGHGGLPVMFECHHNLAPTSLQFPERVQLPLGRACQNELAVAPQMPYERKNAAPAPFPVLI
jgi:hypothetical protein